MATRRPSTTGTLALTLAGLGVGLLAGLALSEWLGGVDRRRVSRAWRRVRPGAPRAAPPMAGVTARTVAAALAADPALAPLGLEVVPVAAGAVELRGWVPSRALRAQAARTARAVPGLDLLVNGLLVQGEDDEHLRPLPTTPDDTAEIA